MRTIFDQQHIRRAFPRSPGSYGEVAALAEEARQFMCHPQISTVGAT